VHEIARQAILRKGYRLTCSHLDILKPFIVKPWLKGFFAPAFQDIDISLKRIAVVRRSVMYIYIRLIDMAGRIKAFPMLQSQDRSCRSLHDDPADTCDIPPQVEDIIRITKPLDINRIDRILDPDRHRTLRHNMLRRHAGKNNILPTGINKGRLIPMRNIQPRVNMFPGINTIKDNRTQAVLQSFPLEIVSVDPSV
jgi:hypothetical protein